MKLFIFLTLISSYSFSQKSIKVKNNIRIEFESITDTIYRGYNNLVYLKGNSDLKGLTVEMEKSSIKKHETQPNTFIVIPTSANKEDYFIIKSKGKEIKRQKVIISVLSKETAKRLLNRIK